MTFIRYHAFTELNVADHSLNNIARGGRVLLAVLVILLGLWGLASTADRSANAQSNTAKQSVVLIRLDGAIDGVVASFIQRGLNVAAAQDSEIVVLMLDTPGGLLDATRDIVESIMASKVPVVVYVAPEGAQAASAGTFIGAAADVLVMAPTTNIGAASVVGADGGDLPETMSEKAIQDAAAFIRSIAETRSRNASALEDTVFSSSAYSASEAVGLKIADFVAADYASLLEQLDSGVVGVSGEIIKFDLGNVTTRTVDLTLLERLLAFISNPNVAFLLVSLGGIGVIVELWNPGIWIPGTLGVVFLILGWAGIGQLPFSWAGVALIGLSLVLFYFESTAPGIGHFGVAGTISLILGGIFLIGFFGSPGIPGDAPIVNRWLLGGIATTAGVFVLWFASEIRKQSNMNLYRSPTMSSELVGATGTATTILAPFGRVVINGEHWSGELEAGSAESVEMGSSVEVVAVRGLRITVKPRPISTEFSTGDEN
ncbi:MAG: nodulation protein NfeD [Chloroflexi bacterium]|nr:nodulation protein NfeD [Chloroflexota bacterium]